MRFAVLLLIIATAVARPVAAGNLAGVTLPDTVVANGKRLTLNGMGLREATMFKVNVYVAALYTEAPSSDPARLLSSRDTKLMVLRFVRDVDRGKIVKAWNDGFNANATTSLPAIKGSIDQLGAWMTDFKKGDTLTFLYVPGDGVYVDVNNVRKGVLKGDDFGRSLFAIWLGPRPPSNDLKRGLLGNHRRPEA